MIINRFLSDKITVFFFFTNSLIVSHLSWNADMVGGVEVVGQNKLYVELVWCEVKSVNCEVRFLSSLVMIFSLGGLHRKQCILVGFFGAFSLSW